MLIPDRTRPEKAFASLSAIYRLLRASYEPHVDVSRSFLRKTELLVQEHTQAGEILDPDKVYELGEDALQAIADSDKPDTVKVFNLVKLLDRLTREEGEAAPHLIPIGQRAREIVEAFEQRQLDTQDALTELERLLNDVTEAKAEQEQSDLSPDSFAVYWLLARKEIPQPDEIAHKAQRAFDTYPYWKTAEAQDREVRRTLLKALIDAGVTDNITELTNWLLDVLRRGRA